MGSVSPTMLLLSPPALPWQDTDHTDTTVKSNGVANGLPPPGPMRREEEDGQGYIRAAGPPTYAVQETSF